MKKAFLLVLIVAVCVFGYSRYKRFVAKNHIPKTDTARTAAHAKEALDFCKKNHYNQDFCLLIDMSIHSGLNRFFVYDFKKNAVTMRMLVGHGCGNYPWSQDWSKDNPSFSNTDGSHLSSLGKYKLGKRAWSDWGIHVKYIMHGLEATNNNAEKRYIVFHSWEKVADKEVYPDGTAEGWGCPTISNNNMKIIDPMLKASKKPVLMWIYK